MIKEIVIFSKTWNINDAATIFWMFCEEKHFLLICFNVIDVSMPCKNVRKYQKHNRHYHRPTAFSKKGILS